MYYSHLCSNDEFDHFYNGTVALADKQSSGLPQFPRQRQGLARLDSEIAQHKFPNAKAYYRQIYFEVSDLLVGVLKDRFSSQCVSSVFALEKTLLSATNGDHYEKCITQLQASCFKDDFNLTELANHLPLLQDVIKKALPQ